MNTPFYLIDVFGQTPFSGNPLPVIFGANESTPQEMQTITHWFNMSETAFVFPPTVAGADYRVRIFTLEREMPFAGHPTLGSCCAWLKSGGKPRRGDLIVQQCGAGLVPIRHVNGELAFAAPPLLRSGPVEADELAELALFLGVDRTDIVDATWADNGPGWVVAMLPSAERVLNLSPKATHPTRMDVGVVGVHPAGAVSKYELRAFFTDQHGNVREDPVTGSLNASVAQWLFATRRERHGYVASQGSRVGRAGRIQLSQDENGQVWVGGKTMLISEGELREGRP